MVALIRVSKEREEMISPELQRTAIEEHCARRGYVVVRWIEGIDESGSARRSAWWARLDEAVEFVEKGEADVVAVWKYSRASRARLRWAVAIDRVESAGGVIESATEPLDTSTSAGRFARGMLAELAAFEAERTSDGWKEVHARRTRLGLPANGKPRFGYLMQDGMHRPDPDTGIVLAAMYRSYIAGASMWAVAAWLNEQGVLTNGAYRGIEPGQWRNGTVRRLLDAGFGAGFIIVQGERIRGAHDPVITDTEWRAYLAARAQRARGQRSERSPLLLSGMVRCWCGAPMFGNGSKPPYYRCSSSSIPGGSSHPFNNSKVEAVDALVFEWLSELASDIDKAETAALAARAQAARRRADLSVLARELVALDKALAQLVVDKAKDPTTPASVYGQAKARLLDERAALETRLAVLDGHRLRKPPAKIAADIVRHWSAWEVGERRAVLRPLVSRVTVTRDSSGLRVVVKPSFAS